jgi:hypothetical protein
VQLAVFKKKFAVGKVQFAKKSLQRAKAMGSWQMQFIFKNSLDLQ